MKKKSWLILIVCAIMVATQSALFFLPTNRYEAFFNVVRPIIYIALLIFALFSFGKDQRTHSGKQTIVIVSILGVVLYLGLNFVAGLFSNFAANAMNTSLFGILRNGWAYMVPIIIREILRAKIMTSFSDKWKYRMCFVIMITFAFCSIDNIANVIRFDLWQQLDWLFTSLLPMLVLNLWLSYSAMNGGLNGNLIYTGAVNAMILFSPILPDMPKILDAIASYAIIFTMFIIYDSVEWAAKRQSEVDVKPRGRRRWWAMIAPGAVLVTCIMFGLGIFPIIPVAVASSSMSPEFNRGDIVYVKRIDPDIVKEGDILQYTRGNTSIIHRVVDIRNMPDGTRYFVTKGDNNSAEDRWPVYDDQIVGIGVASTPFLGWPALLFHDLK